MVLHYSMEKPEYVGSAFDEVMGNAVKGAGSAIGAFLPLLLRIAPIVLFFWYGVEFTITLFQANQPVWAILLVLALAALLIWLLIAWSQIKKKYESLVKENKQPPARVGPYYYPLLLLVLAVLIFIFWEVSFST